MKTLRIKGLRALLWLIGHLPLAFAQALGRVIGLCLWVARDRTRKVTERSLALAYPYLPEAERTEFDPVSPDMLGYGVDRFWSGIEER